MITRCPVCDTSFRITEAQLHTAKGAVRCGSCLQIFKAMDNLVPPRGAGKEVPAATRHAGPAQGTKPRPKIPTAGSTLSRPGTASTGAAASAADYTQEEGLDLAASLPAAGKEALEAAAPSSAKSEESWQQGFDMADVSDHDGQENMLRFDQAAIDDSEESPDDRIFADDLMISDDMSLNDDNASRSNIFEDGLNDSFLDLDAWAEEKSLFDHERKPGKYPDDDEQVAPDESWAIELLEEDDEPASPTPPSQAPGKSNIAPAIDDELSDLGEPEVAEGDDYGNYSRANSGSFSARDDHDFDLFGDSEVRREDRALTATDVPADTNDDYPDADDYLGAYDDDNDRHALLSGIEPEPVEFAVYQGRDWRGKLAWASAAMLGLLLLIGQFAWLQFDSLSRTQPYRDIYGSICPMIGCQLPSLAAPDKIRTSNLVVRSHPHAEGALMVDTILLNTASFHQPFPDLVLNFSNIHGEMLASRRFTPGEYLAGELAGRTNMPSNQPVHLSLEIVDPGPDAINYSAYIPR